MINGDAKSRAEWFSYALGTIGLSAVGTKGLGAVSKTGMATTKVVTKAGASKVKGAVEKISNLNLLPYAPRNQLAYENVGAMPYNVVNGAGTKNQLLTMAKMETRSSKGTKGMGKYQVGAYKDIKGVEGLDAHHAGQKAAMKKLVENYDLNTAPAINVPKVGHTIKGPNGIVSRSTKGIDNPRQLLARDIRELRRVYNDIPNSKLKERAALKDQVTGIKVYWKSSGVNYQTMMVGI